MVYVSVSMFAVYKSVRSIEKNAEKYNFMKRFQTQKSKKTMKRSRRVMIQGILYCASMLFVTLFGFTNFIHRLITRKSILAMQMLVFVTPPLQGILNMLIYLVPEFRKKLKMYRQRKSEERKNTMINPNTMHLSSVEENCRG